MDARDLLRSWVAPRQADSGGQARTRADLVDVLYGGRDPVPAHSDATLPPAFPWSLSDETLEWIQTRLPSHDCLLVEVGTFWGDTSIRLAKRGHTVLCVDTWLGDLHMWQDPAWLATLRDGTPSYYAEFVQNVLTKGCRDRVLPLRLPSTMAARLLNARGVRFDGAYIDGSHDFADVLADLHCYWALLRPGGVLFGDDLHIPDVARAVREWSSSTGVTLDVREQDEGQVVWVTSAKTI